MISYLNESKRFLWNIGFRDNELRFAYFTCADKDTGELSIRVFSEIVLY